MLGIPEQPGFQKVSSLFNKLRLHDYHLVKLREVKIVDFPCDLGLLSPALNHRNALEYSDRA